MMTLLRLIGLLLLAASLASGCDYGPEEIADPGGADPGSETGAQPGTDGPESEDDTPGKADSPLPAGEWAPISNDGSVKKLEGRQPVVDSNSKPHPGTQVGHGIPEPWTNSEDE